MHNLGRHSTDQWAEPVQDRRHFHWGGGEEQARGNFFHERTSGLAEFVMRPQADQIGAEVIVA